jgi:hypothetical protein
MSSLTNQTLESLKVSSGSVGIQTRFGNYSFEDKVLERYYNTDHPSVELNIDFTDYSKFVFYGSAASRLGGFRQKLIKIENLQKQLQQMFVVYSGSFSGSEVKLGPVTTINEDNITLLLSASSFHFTGSDTTSYYIQEKTKKISLEIEQIIRSMDQYEQYLFFNTDNEPYSASFAYTEGGTEYHVSSTWPKNTIQQVFGAYTDSGSTWYAEQLDIAQRYDEHNQNNLIYTVPLHILEDENSTDFVTFITMIGNFFDNIKPYIDQFPNIYDRSPDPNEGLSGELVHEIAEAMGVKFPNLLAIRDIQEYVLGTTESDPIRTVTAETWKRLLHNIIFILKSKGTRAAIEAVFRSLGFHPQLISIKETGILDVSSYQIVDEFTNSLRFHDVSGSNIAVSQRTTIASGAEAKTFQFRFATNKESITSMSLFTADTTWKAELVAHPSYSGLQRIEIKTSNLLPRITSSYTSFNDGDFYDVMVRKNGTIVDLTVYKNYAGDIAYSSYHQETFGSIKSAWDATSIISLGGTGSLSVNSFDGYIDEVRLWGETIGDTEFIAQSNDPGSIVGNTYSSSIENLYFQLSFVTEYNLSNGYIPNESPYKSASIEYPSASLQGFVSNSAYERLERQVRYNIPTLGPSSYVSNQIKIKDFNVSSSIPSGSTVPTLYYNKSHTLLAESQSGQPVRQIHIGISPTDFINQRISRTFGSLNITDTIGDPSGLLGEEYTQLKELQDYYSTHFAYDIDINRLISIFETLVYGLREFFESIIPAHSNLLFGIIIEPNLLERRKVTSMKEISIDGTGTRKTINAIASSSVRDRVTFSFEETINVSKDIVRVSADPIRTYSGSLGDQQYTTFEFALDEPKTTESAEYVVYETETPISDIAKVNYVESTKPLISGNVDLITFPTLESRIDLELYEPVTQNGFPFNLPQGIEADVKYYFAIEPNTDLNDIGVTTYFNNSNGLYLFPTSSRVSVPRFGLNFLSQSWVRGTAYMPNDVVYQTGLSGSARQGNGIYYRYTIKPVTTLCTSELISASLCTVGQSGSYFDLPVKSYVPPSLDGYSWQPVKWIDSQSLVEKRVIFDNDGTTLNIVDPSLDNSTNTRRTISFNGIAIGASATIVGSFDIQNIFSILAYKVSVGNIRLRLFATPEDQGLLTNALLDTTITTTNQFITLANAIVVYNNESPATTKIYYVIDNLEAQSKSVTLEIIYFGIETRPFVPLGYLPRHYKFYRDSTTATRRRNFLGCLQTQNTTLDGGLPVEITISPSSELVISPNANQTDIQVGGGGTLDVNT